MTVHTLQVANNGSDSEFYSDATLVCDPVIYIYIYGFRMWDMKKWFNHDEITNGDVSRSLTFQQGGNPKH